ncbi:hypothetical protein PspLS_10969 [Pyricularia sp. CBS 133598]|nr:hypothetical protein PspLS_10969 [Pyricularia sp. CBS 133598]
MSVQEQGNGSLDLARHLRYFTRCMRTLLPQQYTSNDSTRMALGFFIISGIDLLTQSTFSADPKQNKNTSHISATDRSNFREWVLSCQHTAGGFAGSTTHTLPPHEYDGWDFGSLRTEPGNSSCSNIAATAFALLLLALLADDASGEAVFYGVDRVATLRWLKKLQRRDGSFGEVLVDIPNINSHDGNDKEPGSVTETIAGGRDMRYCYLASIIRWILRGDVQPEDPGWVEDIDVEALVRHIRAGQTFDGGVAESSMHESHAGYAYCAVSALSLLGRPLEGNAAEPQTGRPDSSINIPYILHFLASRQFEYTDVASDEDEDEENFFHPDSLSRLSITDEYPPFVGFNGRVNKVADTCYCWWVCGTADILRQMHSSEGVDVSMAQESARRFLMEKTQHMIGGFSKHPGGPPDVYHAYFGLSALAVLGEPGLKPFDVGLCVSKDTIAKIEVGRRGLFRRMYTADDASNPQTNKSMTGAPKLSRRDLLSMGEDIAGCNVNDLKQGQTSEGPALLEQIVQRAGNSLGVS